MENTGKMMRFDNFFLFKNKTASGLVRIYDLFRELEVTTYHPNNKLHMHDQLVIRPEETKRTSLRSTATSVNPCTWTREEHFQHREHVLRDDTKMVLISFQHYCQPSKLNPSKHGGMRMLSMGSITSLLGYSRELNSSVAGTGQMYR